ncbi:hypothetical protein MAN88_25650 [Microcystis aeruginosa]|nr:hypothetical protein MAN88_25650 [Microcystis aeruginosa]
MPPYRTILSNEEPLISYLVIYLSSSLSLITDYCSLITDYCSLITELVLPPPHRKRGDLNTLDRHFEYPLK